jgi:hypothetical protein
MIGHCEEVLELRGVRDVTAVLYLGQSTPAEQGDVAQGVSKVSGEPSKNRVSTSRGIAVDAA